MSSRAKLVCLGGALPSVVILAHGCRGPTQVTIDLSTNVVCSDLRGVDIVVAGDAHRAEDRAALLTGNNTRFASATTDACSEGSNPRRIGTLVATPAGESGAVVVIAAFGNAKVADCAAPKLAPTCIVARRRFAFADGRQLVLPIVLDPDCAGIACNETSTCVGKKCVDSIVDCSRDACSEPGVIGADGGVIVVDAASPLDNDAAGNPDGAPGDAATDASSDAVSEVGTDAGSTSCGGTCVGNPGPVCPVGSACCYETTLSSCQPASTCPGIAACCHGATNCPADMICCADTPTPAPGTRMTCRTPTECAALPGAKVCSTVDTECHGQGNCDPGAVYSGDPEFFECS